MSAFPRVRAPGMWLALSQLGHAEMEEFDDHQSKALNAEEGGAWAPTSRIILGGDGLQIQDASLYIGNGGGGPGTLDVTDGSGALWRSGSALLQYAGAEWIMSGTTALGGAGTDANGGAGHHVVSGGKLYIDDGAYLRIRAGGEILLGGTLTAQALSVVSLSGATEQDGGSFALTNGTPMTLHGDVTIESDGTLVTEAGSTTTLGGTHNLTGTLQTSGAAAEIIVKANGSFTSEALATVSHAGDVEVAGTLDVSGTLAMSGELAQTGPHTKSGTTAQTCERFGYTLDAHGTYGVEKDVWFVVALTANREYTLRSTTSPVPQEGARVVFSIDDRVEGFGLTFYREDTSVIVSMPSGQGAWVEFIFRGGSWRYFRAGKE